MPEYVFECTVCGEHLVREFAADDVPSKFVSWCGKHSVDAPCVRRWSAPAIGRVDGAGGSPSRGSK